MTTFYTRCRALQPPEQDGASFSSDRRSGWSVIHSRARLTLRRRPVSRTLSTFSQLAHSAQEVDLPVPPRRLFSDAAKSKFEGFIKVIKCLTFPVLNPQTGCLFEPAVLSTSMTPTDRSMSVQLTRRRLPGSFTQLVECTTSSSSRSMASARSARMSACSSSNFLNTRPSLVT